MLSLYCLSHLDAQIQDDSHHKETETNEKKNKKRKQTTLFKQQELNVKQIMLNAQQQLLKAKLSIHLFTDTFTTCFTYLYVSSSGYKFYNLTLSDSKYSALLLAQE